MSSSELSIDEIASNNFDLSLQKYVFINNSFAVESYNMSDCFAKWQIASNDLHVSINQLTDLLK